MLINRSQCGDDLTESTGLDPDITGEALHSRRLTLTWNGASGVKLRYNAVH